MVPHASSRYPRSFAVRLGSTYMLLANFRRITYSVFISHCGVLRSFPLKMRLLIRAISNAKTCLVFDEVASPGWPDGTCSKSERAMSPYLRVVGIQRTFLKVFSWCWDVDMSRTVLALFMRLSWCETCNVVTSRCRMLLSSFGCPGENALRYKEWIGKCSAEKKERTTGLTSDVASTLTRQLFHHYWLAPLAFVFSVTA